MDEDELRYAAGAIADADTVVAMTGAGVSTASGLPDFRGPDGLWNRFDMEDFHVRRFRADPAAFWEDRLELDAELYGGDGVEPNAAHEALAGLEASGHVETLVTQNVDGLHQEAGHEDVVELHGNGQRVVCFECGERAAADEAREAAERIIGMDLKGLHVDSVLVEEAVDFTDELYVGVTMDRGEGKPVAMVSTEGGVDIESVAEETPEAIESEDQAEAIAGDIVEAFEERVDVAVGHHDGMAGGPCRPPTIHGRCRPRKADALAAGAAGVI